jgi:5-dehydro-2-deoxygluconokinase
MMCWLAPIRDCAVFEFAGTNLSKDPCRTATLFAAEMAKQANVTVVLDLDFRPDQWPDPRFFGVTLRAALSVVDIVLGTADEINALMLSEPAQMSLTHSQISDARVKGDVGKNTERILQMGPQIVIHKTGSRGCRIHRQNS